jgi:hypothetical protein
MARVRRPGALRIPGQAAAAGAALEARGRDVRLSRDHVGVGARVGEGSVRWRPEWDKNGVDETVPLRLPAQLAIEIALEWHARTGYAGEWLIPNVQKNKKGEAIYDQQSLWWALKAAQTRGGIENRRGRGAHGLRKLLSGDVTEITGDFLLGLRAIGDRDPRRAAEYIQKRDDRLEEAFARWTTGGPSDENFRTGARRRLHPERGARAPTHRDRRTAHELRERGHADAQPRANDPPREVVSRCLRIALGVPEAATNLQRKRKRPPPGPFNGGRTMLNQLPEQDSNLRPPVQDSSNAGGDSRSFPARASDFAPDSQADGAKSPAEAVTKSQSDYCDRCGKLCWGWAGSTEERIERDGTVICGECAEELDAGASWAGDE